MQNEYYMTLPSNSSANIFPENTTTRFKTLLPREWRLDGEWVVGLSEIIFPQTFSHVKPSDEWLVRTIIRGKNFYEKSKTKKFSEVWGESIPHGVYNSLGDLLDEINALPNFKKHCRFEKTSGSHVYARIVCDKECSEKNDHSILMSYDLINILGYQGKNLIIPGKEVEIRPASLRNALPSLLFVYTDICESVITGDEQTPLLRVVTTNLEHFEYGSTRVQIFSPPKYIPLLKNYFSTIELNICTEHGLPVPFDGGTLTVTLHFKRID